MKDMIRIVEPHSLREYADVQQLHQVIWGLRDIDITPIHILIASQRSNGLVLCAYIGSEPVGFIHAFCGYDQLSKSTYMYSHNLGVVPRLQGQGIGFQLKLRQRELALERTISTIRWTFDPLDSRNAHMNLNKLGCRAIGYVENYWGEMQDEINRGLDSDRIIVEWQLRSFKLADVGVSRYIDETRPKLVYNHVVLDNSGFLVPGDFNKDALESKQGVCFIEIPPDFQRIKQSGQDLAVRWRNHIREGIQQLTGHGYVLSQFVRMPPNHAYYVFESSINSC